jgi:hypothetical protein
MQYRDEDINFEMFGWQRFEELCFDLLHKYQFYGLNWNKGGADGGRDIEACFGVSNPVTGFYEEKWYIECKHYTQKVSKDKLAEKFAQARVEHIDHFLIITNSYLSKGTKTWLSNLAPTLNFKIHLLEGKNLNKKLLEFPELVAEYFADDNTRLAKSLYKLWLHNDSLPDIRTLYRLSKEADPERLATTEMVFLIYVLGKLDNDFDDLHDDDLEEFDFDHFIPFIAAHPTTTGFPVLNKEEQKAHHAKYYLGHRFSSSAIWSGKGINSHFFHDVRPLGENELLEMFFERDIHKRLELRVGIYRHSKHNATINTAEA